MAGQRTGVGVLGGTAVGVWPPRGVGVGVATGVLETLNVTEVESPLVVVSRAV